MKKGKRIAVIGGGASGFFGAINTKELMPDSEVTIFEKTNQVLTKVKVSGGGRCNVTHACFDPQELTQYYPRGEKELRGPFHQFMTYDTIEWFGKRGVELKTEEDGRMFPVSNQSQDIIDCFLKSCEENNIAIKLKSELNQIMPQEKGYRLSFTNGQELFFDVVLIASGGNAKLSAYHWINEMDLQIITPRPSLFTFNLPKHPITQLMGLSVDHAVVSLSHSNYESEGPLLITHWGMSGPAVLKLSSYAAIELNKRNYQFSYQVNWSGVEDHDSMEIILNQYKNDYPKRSIMKHKTINIPSRLWEYLVKVSISNPDCNWGDCSKKDLEQLATNLTEQSFIANGKTTFKEEFVSCGGVDNKEINFKRMECRKYPNLYFAGEVLNIDAVTGGFNFQAAWTTAYIAAKAIAEV
ncbi:NAD(P)/FAD-dependent oxidoreductase [bacterium]|nr:NAD(P)/FAD-dependent oxidoreductase [bacterium]